LKINNIGAKMEQEQIEKMINDYYSSNGYNSNTFKGITDEQFVSNIIVKVSSGGSSGGDCWGGRSSSYDNSESEIKGDIVSELSYYLKENLGLSNVDDLLSEIAEELYSGGYFDTSSDYGDYYGNYTSYTCYLLPFKTLFEKLKEKSLISEEDLDLCNTVFEEKSNEKAKELFITTTNNQFRELSESIAKFNQTKDDELNKIKNELKNARSIVERLEKKLDSFEKDKHQEHNRLLSRKSKMESEHGDILVDMTVKPKRKP
jgi:hypothetical protein